MKKFAKMSLVAAVAVAGFTSANAASLAEAIKGVDVSGTLVYRYNDYDGESKEGVKNYYKLATDVSIPVNDTISAGLTFEANSGFSSADTTTSGEVDPEITLGGANFTFTGIADTTLIMGKQAVPTPWTVAADSDGATHNGTGIVAVNTSTPVTLVGAYFNQTNFGMDQAGDSIYVIGASANVAGLALSAFYADQLDNLDSYTLSADYKAKMDGIALGAGIRYTNLDASELGASDDNELTKMYIKAKAGIFDAKIAYGFTGDEGGLVAFDNSAATAMEGWNTSLNGQVDADYVQLHAGVQATETINVALNWFNVEGDTTADDAEEVYTQITWKPSKNFYTYVRLGQVETANNDESDVGRLQMQYSF